MNQILKKQYSPIGLEISHDAIRMIQVRKDNGSWALHRAAEESFGLHDEEAEEASTKKAALIKKMAKDYSFSGRQVVTTLSNRDVDILPVRLPSAEENGLEDKIIENARARLPYKVEQAVIDYLPIETFKKSGEGEKSFWIIASHRSLVEQHLTVIKEAGLHTKALDIQPCALMRSLVTSGYAADGNHLLVHMGDRDSLFLFVGKAGLLGQRMYLKGYQDMADKLTEGLKIERGEAFRLLAHYGFIGRTPDREKKGAHNPDSTASAVHEIILPSFKETFEGIKNFVNYCHAEIGEIRIEKIVLSGKACLIRNLEQMIEHGSDIKTAVLNPFTTLGVKQDELAHINPMHGSVFTVPLGLTLRE
jgi:type IV pilus assembly protein PilM